MTSGPPPRLQFDDGSRIITENSLSHLVDTSVNNILSDETASPPITTTTTADETNDNTNYDFNNPRRGAPIHTYYEIDRVSSEIVDIIINQATQQPPRTDGFLCAVAIQFPDEQLGDSSEVAWLLEDAIATVYHEKNNHTREDNDGDGGAVVEPLVFILGDTTYSPCCPDEIGALHLSADLIVHYGRYACLSPAECLPVVYSFGRDEWDGLEDCVDSLVTHISSTTADGDEEVDGGVEENEKDVKFLLLYEVRYQHVMDRLGAALRERCKGQVVIGTLPKEASSTLVRNKILPPPQSSSSCCGSKTNNDRPNNGESNESSCCGGSSNKAKSTTTCATTPSQNNACNNNNNNDVLQIQYSNNNENVSSSSILQQDTNSCIIGGLQVPLHPSSLSHYTLLFIGDDSGDAKSRQLFNTILYCTSLTTGTRHTWSYNPSTSLLSTDPSSNIGVSRFLNRRFYLIQKAKVASIIGILVGTLSQSRFRSVVAQVRAKVEDSGRACYTFVVGKINIAKLANFAEVECFVLVSCGETSVLADEREFHIPIITPVELEIALGEKEWGGSGSCNTDFGEFLEGTTTETEDDGGEVVADSSEQPVNDNELAEFGGETNDDNDDDDTDDEPIFSMISGTYVSMPKKRSNRKNTNNNDDTTVDNNLTSQPGGGQLTEYRSEAAEFWKQREYKGLEAQIGQMEAKPATLGQTGIASDYGNR